MARMFVFDMISRKPTKFDYDADGKDDISFVVSLRVSVLLRGLRIHGMQSDEPAIHVPADYEATVR